MRDSRTDTWTNQSMVQQLTSEGNMRQRDLKASPTGLMHSTMCSLDRTREMKYWKTYKESHTVNFYSTCESYFLAVSV